MASVSLWLAVNIEQFEDFTPLLPFFCTFASDIVDNLRAVFLLSDSAYHENICRMNKVIVSVILGLIECDWLILF